jgi:N-acetylmuramoyl-L-alanine amidase/LGFP repeat
MSVRLPRRFTLSGTVGSLTAVACGALLVGSLTEPTHAVATASERSTAVRSDGPHPVTATIAKTSVPSVMAAARPRTTKVLRAAGASGTSAGSTLAAHLVRTSLAPFQVAGVTWRSRPLISDISVQVRTLTRAGWGQWQPLPVDGDGPSSGESKARGARPGTQPLWTATATGIEVAVSTATGAAPKGLQVSTIDPGRSTYDAKAVARTSATLSTGAAKAGTAPTVLSTPAASPGRALTRDGFPEMPRIIKRKQWGANPKLTEPCWDPIYGDSLKMVFIHHTVNSNDYSAAQAPALMRGILAYHTQGQGWCDIGYNFVVDRFGNIYEGRRGGIRKPVRGAHAGDYNTDSTGISMLGNFDTSRLTTVMQNALVRLVGWRLGTAYKSGTGPERLAGKRFKRISGHRDAMATACPGRYGYAFLPTLRSRVNWYLAPMRTHIRRAYLANGKRASDLGRVYQGEMGLPGGHMTVFQHGRMYYAPATHRGVTTLMRGQVLAKYRSLGGPRSDLGFPKTSDLSFSRGTVKEVRFRHGNIYASKRTGAHALTGKILRKYFALRSFNGRLGLPTTNSVTHRKYVAANFVNGRIVYTFATKQFTITYED